MKRRYPRNPPPPGDYTPPVTYGFTSRKTKDKQTIKLAGVDTTMAGYFSPDDMAKGVQALRALAARQSTQGQGVDAALAGVAVAAQGVAATPVDRMQLMADLLSRSPGVTAPVVGEADASPLSESRSNFAGKVISDADTSTSSD